MRAIGIKLAAKQYGYSIKTLYKWSSEGRYPGLIFRVGRHLLFDEDQWDDICKKAKEESEFLQRAKRRREPS